MSTNATTVDLYYDYPTNPPCGVPQYWSQTYTIQSDYTAFSTNSFTLPAAQPSVTLDMTATAAGHSDIYINRTLSTYGNGGLSPSSGNGQNQQK